MTAITKKSREYEESKEATIRQALGQAESIDNDVPLESGFKDRANLSIATNPNFENRKMSYFGEKVRP